MYFCQRKEVLKLGFVALITGKIKQKFGKQKTKLFEYFLLEIFLPLI